MRKLADMLIAFALVSAMLFTIALVFGLTPEGLGHWPESHDHPTNWNDTALHP